MIFSFQQVDDFLVLSSSWNSRNVQDHPFKYAIKKVSLQIQKQINKVREPFNEQVEDAEMDSWLTVKETGAYLLIDSQRQRTPELDKAFAKKKREISAALEKEVQGMEFNIAPYIATAIPESLTIEEKEAFTGFII